VAQEFVSSDGKYPQQVADISYGLLAGTTDETYFLSPSPGAANTGLTSDNPLQRIVINEIMYHTDSLNETEEYIELYNNGADAIDISGWQLSSGVRFDFPQGTSLNAGAHLVVAADSAVFSTKYPSVNPAIIHGNWQGRLANGGESVELINQLGDLVDRVTYADQGDWAQRVRGPDDQGHRGWRWNALHDAGGRSLELINPDMPNDQGQNWAGSDVVQGTPGLVNSVTSNDIAPIITDVGQSILMPNASAAVTITAKVRDESTGPLEASLFYRIDGVAAEDGRAVQLRVNGNDLAESGSTMFGSYVQVEALGSDFARNHFPGDGNGNLYSIRDTVPEEGDLRYEGTNPDAYRDTYFKNTNEDSDDWSDLIALTDALNNSTDEQFFAAVSAAANLDQWFRFFAADTLLLNQEGGLPTGRGDDYTIYRGIDDSRFVLIPHDLDTLLDQGDDSPYATRSLFDYEAVDGMSRLFTHPETVGLYYQHLLDLASTAFSPESINDYVDQMLGAWVPQQVVQNYKETAAARRDFVLSQIPTQLTVTSNLALAGAAQSFRTTDGLSAGLSGNSHAGLTRSVMVNGVEANWDARNADWTLNTLPLDPGLNRLIVQAFDGASGAGALIDAQSIDIWYDRGGMTEVTTIGQQNVTWSAANGPYHLSQDITVPFGATLTIEPGTSVFFDEGVEFRVEGTLVAAGTQFDRIRFSSVPDAAFVPDEPGGPGLPDGPPRWAGIHLVDTMANENIIAFADIEYAQDNANNQGAIGVIRAQAVLDNLTFKGTHLRTVNGVNSSRVISNSIFPDVFAENEYADAPAGTVSQLELIHNFIDPLLATSRVGSRPGTILDLSTAHVVDNVNFVDQADGDFELGAGSRARGTGPFSMDFG
jgi:CotH protein/lamin tail-like protein